LNGIDYEMWNTELDAHIPHHYNADSLEGKYRNKEALRDRLWLRKDYKPLIAYVGRLDTQKGLHLIRHALFYSLWNGAQFVLLGSGSELGINDYFWHLRHHLNENPDCHLEIGFDEELAHLIYAGADMIVVPSMFEPCGLTQMIALRYGMVPIVRAVGGLTDTVFDRDYSSKPPWERNGYVFHHADYAAIESAMRRAIGLWYLYPEEFRQLIINGMRYDYSWNHPGQNYVNVYEYIRHK
jgi:starch synthase